MSKEQVMDYVMNSPANTNPNVLSGMLDGISGTQLPSPTESDNGKVLGVDNGEYKLVEQSGGSKAIGDIVLLGAQIAEAGYSLRYKSGSDFDGFDKNYPFIPIYEDVEIGDDWSLAERTTATSGTGAYSYSFNATAAKQSSVMWMQNVTAAIISTAGGATYAIIKLTNEIIASSEVYFGSLILNTFGDAKAIVVAMSPNPTAVAWRPFTLVKGNVISEA